jgi:MoxR-like ATPase
MAARARAFLQHRGYVTPEDVKAVALDVLRHRVSLSYEAEAEEITSDRWWAGCWRPSRFPEGGSSGHIR